MRESVKKSYAFVSTTARFGGLEAGRRSDFGELPPALTNSFQTSYIAPTFQAHRVEGRSEPRCFPGTEVS